MPMPHPPDPDEQGFDCPHCGAFAQMTWITLLEPSSPHDRAPHASEFQKAKCFICEQESVWFEERMILPTDAIAPMPHQDLPQPLHIDYLEARDISQRSPRGAAALLRLVIEQLSAQVGGGGSDLNARIGDLVRKGLDPSVQKMLDTIRVIGGQAVHPLTMDLRDDQETAQALFWLVNEIVEEMITRPKRINALYDMVPQPKREAIEKRDRVD